MLDIRGGRGDALYKSTVDIDIDIDINFISNPAKHVDSSWRSTMTINFSIADSMQLSPDVFYLIFL